MNGISIIDPKQSGLVGRLLGRRPKENAIIEINNLLSILLATELEYDKVSEILSSFGTNRQEMRDRLMNLYNQVLSYLVSDLELSDQDIQDLQHLQTVFELSQDEVRQLHNSVIYPIYERAVHKALQDRKLTDLKNAYLDNLAGKLRIHPSVRDRLYGEIAKNIYETAVQLAISDRRLSPEKEAELDRLAKDLNLNINTTRQTQDNLERFRQLWRLSQGEISFVPVPIHLQKNESCATFVGAS